MATVEILTTLFRGSRERKLPISGGTLGVNVAAPRGQFYSAARGSAVAAAKISHAATVLDGILNGRIAAIEGRDSAMIYAEISGSSGTNRVRFDGNHMNWDKAPTAPGRLCVPFVLFALQKHSQMTETKSIFEKCVDDFSSTGRVSDENLYRFCDAFYYEWKQKYSVSSIPSDDYLSDEIIRQSIRTGSLAEFSLFAESGFSGAATIQIENVTRTATPAANTESDEMQYTRCKNGDYAIDYCWSAEQRALIPETSSLEKYVPSPEYYNMLDLIHSELGEVQARMEEGLFGVQAIQNNYVNMILVGKPGTGKTTTINALGAALQMPVYVVAPNKNSEEDLFTGMTKVSNGALQFVQTDFLKGFSNGGIILIEEFNVADQAVIMGALGQAVEKPFILAEDGYKAVRRHPLCVIVCTMNSGTQGSREPSEAFTSRFPDTFMMEDPTQDQFIDILQSHGYPKTACKQVYMAYGKIVTALKNRNAEDVALAVTMRHCLSALRQWCKRKRPLQEALRNTFVGAIATKDRMLAEEIYNDIIKNLPNV